MSWDVLHVFHWKKKKIKAQTDTHQRPGNPDWRHKINAPAGGRAPTTTEEKTIGNKTIGNHGLTASGALKKKLTSTTHMVLCAFPDAFQNLTGLDGSGSKGKPNSKSLVFVENALSTTFLITYTLTGKPPLNSCGSLAKNNQKPVCFKIPYSRTLNLTEKRTTNII